MDGEQSCKVVIAISSGVWLSAIFDNPFAPQATMNMQRKILFLRHFESLKQETRKDRSRIEGIQDEKVEEHVQS